MKIIEEFKQFALKGSVVDLAVGIVIGAAFGKIVSAFVDGILMPLLGILIGGVDFSQLTLKLRGDAVLAYGNFIQVTIDFLIVAWAIFLAIKFINKLKRKEKKEQPAGPSEEIKLLTAIRDELKK
jgi:large conductance mechanosensitive channel